MTRWGPALRLATLSFLLLASGASAQSTSAGSSKKSSAELKGHLKLQLLGASYGEQSLFRDALGSDSLDLNLDLRINLSARAGRWGLLADAQVVGLAGDTIELGRGSAGASERDTPLLVARFPDDRRRAFDLTQVHTDRGRFAGLSRFDRLSLGYRGQKTVVRAGRQAVTWGNGFVYTPMDIFNPFDPTAIDKEYKAGDDMLYAERSRSGGDDVQAVAVFRRDPVTGALESERGSLAVKYHGLRGLGEYDLLIAEHYGDTLVGFGGNRSFGGAVWRGDLTVTRTDLSTIASLVTSLSYSWVWGGKNTSGLLEYFHNGFGQSGERYSPEDLAANPDLVSRVVRGELFSLGRNYVAASATLEITPLFLLTPNLFVNVEDPSALLQIVTQNDLMQDLILQAALAVPLGGPGTELGGVDAGMGQYLSNQLSVFVQLAWYF